MRPAHLTPTKLAATILGIVVAWALWNRFWLPSDANAHARKSISPTGAATATAVLNDVAQRARQLADESRLHELEGRVAQLAASSAPSAKPPNSEPTESLDLVAQRAQNERAHEDAVALHWTEPPDREWSRPAAQNLERELDGIAKSAGFSVIRTDCRTQSCVAVTEWPDYATAEKNWSKVLNHRYGLPCGVQVQLKEPSDQQARYQTTVLFTCDLNDRISL